MPNFIHTNVSKGLVPVFFISFHLITAQDISSTSQLKNADFTGSKEDQNITDSVYNKNAGSSNETGYEENHYRLNMDRSMPLTVTISAPRQKPEGPSSISGSSKLNTSIVEMDTSVSKESSEIGQKNEALKMKRSDKIIFAIGTGVVIGVTAAVILVKLKGRKNNTESEIPDPPLPPEY